MPKSLEQAEHYSRIDVIIHSVLSVSAFGLARKGAVAFGILLLLFLGETQQQT